MTYVGQIISREGKAMGMMPHSHPFAIEVCYVTKGHVDWWTGATSFRLDPQDLLVVLPQYPHGAVDSAQQPCEYYWVHLGSDQLDPLVSEALERPGFHGVHRCKPDLGEMVVKLMNEHRNPMSSATKP